MNAMGRFIWPLFRVAALLAAMPVIGTQLVPMRIRLGMAVVITLALMPVLPAMPIINGLSIGSYLLVIQQLLIGFGMAFLLQMFIQIFVVAGQMMAMQMGLGFASLVDPVNGVSVAVLSQFYLMLVMLLFLAMNGHLVVFEVLAESFITIPVAAVAFDVQLFSLLASWISWMFASAVIIALPAVTATLIVNFAFGIMNRAAPQLNVFSLGFPFTMIFGLVIVFISLSGFLPQFQNLSGEALQMLRQWITP